MVHGCGPSGSPSGLSATRVSTRLRLQQHAAQRVVAYTQLTAKTDTRGIPRLISHTLRISLILADERGQSSIDPAIVNTATILLHLEAAKPVVMPLPKPRLDRDPRSRG